MAIESEQRIIEILENYGYTITGSCIAEKDNRIDILFLDLGEKWLFRVGRNTVGDLRTAIDFSKRKVVN